MTHSAVTQKRTRAPSNDRELGVPLPRRLGIESGLPSHNEVQGTLSRLAGRIELTAKPKNSDGDSARILFEAGESELYTEKQHELFLSEFASEVDEVALRINRLKLRIATVILRAGYFKEDSTPFDRDHPLENLSSQTYTCKTDGITSEEERAILVRDFNRVIPEQFRISDNPLLSGHDAELMYRVAGAMRFYREPSSSEEIEVAQLLLERVTRIGRQLKEIEQSPLLFSLADAKNDHQEVVRSCWSGYREIIKQMAALEEYGNWCSPGYGESLKPQRGRSQHVEPFKTDYQRWHTPLVQDLDRTAHKVFFRETTYNERGASFLFSSGMAAFEAVFQLIAEDQEALRRLKKATPRIPEILSTKGLYFEAKDSITSFCERSGIPHREICPATTKEIIKTIVKNRPHAVFLEPLANSYGAQVTEVGKIISALTRLSRQLSEQGKNPTLPITMFTLSLTVLRWARLHCGKIAN